MKTKWFYPLQAKANEWLNSYFINYNCEWQDVIEKEGIVYERFSGTNKENNYESVLITYRKKTESIDVYKKFEV